MLYYCLECRDYMTEDMCEFEKDIPYCIYCDKPTLEPVEENFHDYA